MGALLMADDANGVIYCVAFAGNGGRSGGASAMNLPAGPMQQQAALGAGMPQAMMRREREGKGR